MSTLKLVFYQLPALAVFLAGYHMLFLEHMEGVGLLVAFPFFGLLGNWMIHRKIRGGRLVAHR